MSRPLSLDRRREVVLEYTYIEAKGFDAGDTILRAAIRKQVGSIVKRRTGKARSNVCLLRMIGSCSQAGAIYSLDITNT
jgi:hypothetical protein